MRPRDPAVVWGTCYPSMFGVGIYDPSTAGVCRQFIAMITIMIMIMMSSTREAPETLIA